jgi:AraC-like DNA-binding protein
MPEGGDREAASAVTDKHASDDAQLMCFIDHAQRLIGQIRLDKSSPLQALANLASELAPLHEAAGVAIATKVFVSVALSAGCGNPSCLRLAGAFARATDAESLNRALGLARSLGRSAPERNRSRRAVELGCERITLAIIAHASDHRLTLDKVAALCRLSRWHVCHLLHEGCRSTFRLELRQARLSRASRLMADQLLTLKEIMWASGYLDTRLFGRHWRQRFGVSPALYRKQRQPPLSNP